MCGDEAVKKIAQRPERVLVDARVAEQFHGGGRDEREEVVHTALAIDVEEDLEGRVGAPLEHGAAPDRVEPRELEAALVLFVLGLGADTAGPPRVCAEDGAQSGV